MTNSRRAYSIAEVCELTGVGRTTIYASITSGALPARKIGRRTILLHDDVVAFLQALPILAPAQERADA